MINVALNMIPLFLCQLSVTDFTRFADVYGGDEEQDSFSNIKVVLVFRFALDCQWDFSVLMSWVIASVLCY